MKTTLYLIITGLILFAHQPVNGQFLDKLRRQVERKSEEHAIKEADKAADKGLDKAADAIWNSIEENEKKDSSDTTSNESDSFAKIMSQIGTGPPVHIAKSYSFDTQVAYEIRSDNNESKDEEVVMDMISWYKEGKNYTATKIKSTQDGQSVNVTTILDIENEAMIMVMEDQKMAQLISTKGTTDEIAEENVELENSAKFKKTGRTKKILGYTCHEYETHSNDTDATFWIAPNAKIYSAGLFQGGMFGQDKPDIDIPKDQQGMLMEMNAIVNDSNGKKSNMKIIVKNIDKKSITINMDDYQKMNFGGYK